jgi:hypothetical protein
VRKAHDPGIWPRALGPLLNLVVIDCVGTTVHMYQIGWNVKTGDRIVEHGAMQCQSVPLCLTNAVTTLASVNSSKVKWPGDEPIGMSEVDI